MSVHGKTPRLRGERSHDQIKHRPTRKTPALTGANDHNPIKTIIHQTQAVSTMLLSSRRFRYYNDGLTITGFRFTIPKTSTTLGGR